jgi:hypothetical protein
MAAYLGRGYYLSVPANAKMDSIFYNGFTYHWIANTKFKAEEPHTHDFHEPADKKKENKK